MTAECTPDVSEVAPGIFRIPLPLPFQLSSVNVYLVDTGDGFVLIDTGVASAEAFAALVAGLDRVKVRLGDISTILVTHFHADHVGQAARVEKRSGAPILMSDVDAGWLVEFFVAGPPALPDDFLLSHGVPEAIATEFQGILPGLGQLIAPFRVGGTVASGDRIPSGRPIAGLLTPGHSPGHLCALLPDEGLLFSGDHVLPHITPNIGLYPESAPDPVGDYLASLELVLQVAPRRIFPGHGPVIEDPPARVRALLQHHQRRLDAAAAATASAPATAWDVTGRIFGDNLDPVQTWMAFFESLAHLEHLARRGLLERNGDGSRVTYSVVG